MYYQASATDPECSSQSGLLMSRKKLTLPLSSSGYTVCLQDHNWHCTNIPKLASSNLCALQKLAFCKWMTPCGAIPKRYQITLTDLFLDCAQLVEWPPDLNSNSWVFSHFQKTSKDIFFASTWLTNTNTYLFYLIKKKKKKILATCTVLD